MNQKNPDHPKTQPSTVIITQSVPDDRVAAYRELQDKLTQRVKAFEGFIGTELLPPKSGVQDSWVVIFRFNCPDSLRTWLDSEERLEVVREMEKILPSKAQLQILAEPPRDHVTVVFSHQIARGKEAEYRNWRARVLAAQEAFDGFLGQESFDPVDGLTGEWVDIARFANKEALDAWLSSAERKRLVTELKPLVENLEIKRMGTGLDGWFRTATDTSLVHAPPAWKQALSVWFALYPIVMLLTYYLNPHLGDIGLPLLMLVGNMISVALLTWLIMPQANRCLHFWLFPKKRSWILDLGVAAGLVLLLLLMWRLFVVLAPQS